MKKLSVLLLISGLLLGCMLPAMLAPAPAPDPTLSPSPEPSLTSTAVPTATLAAERTLPPAITPTPRPTRTPYGQFVSQNGLVRLFHSRDWRVERNSEEDLRLRHQWLDINLNIFIFEREGNKMPIDELGRARAALIGDFITRDGTYSIDEQKVVDLWLDNGNPALVVVFLLDDLTGNRRYQTQLQVMITQSENYWVEVGVMGNHDHVEAAHKDIDALFRSVNLLDRSPAEGVDGRSG